MSRRPTSRGLALIQRWEGFPPDARYAARPYLCPGGYWTIGWGAIVALDGQRVTEHTPPVDHRAATALLLRDVARFARAVERLCPVALTEGQFNALVSFAFNLGSGALQASTLRRCVLRGDHAAAADQFHRWVFAGGRKLRGLVLRRADEAALYAGGTMSFEHASHQHAEAA